MNLPDPELSFPLAVNTVTNKIYVSTIEDLYVIDGKTNRIVANMSVGVGLNPDTNKIYVANVYSNSVSVIDGSRLHTNTSEQNTLMTKSHLS